jgi:hypothetical protein
MYIIENQLTGEEKEDYWSTYDSFQEFLRDNRDWVQGAPRKMSIGYSTGSSFKVDNEFKSLLKTIGKANPKGKVETR